MTTATPPGPTPARFVTLIHDAVAAWRHPDGRRLLLTAGNLFYRARRDRPGWHRLKGAWAREGARAYAESRGFRRRQLKEWTTLDTGGPPVRHPPKRPFPSEVSLGTGIVFRRAEEAGVLAHDVLTPEDMEERLRFLERRAAARQDLFRGIQDWAVRRARGSGTDHRLTEAT